MATTARGPTAGRYNGRALSPAQPGGTLETIRARWRGAPSSRRRVVLGALLGLIALALLVLLLGSRLPCEFPGGDACAPPDEVAEIVPADALAYVHANLETDGEQYERAAEAAAAVPRFSSELVERLVRALSDGRGSTDAFEEDVRPWFGGEAAFALLDAEEEVVILEVAEGNDDAAQDFAESLRKPERGKGEPKPLEHEGVEILTDRAGVATALIDGFLAVGPPDALRAVIDTARSSGEEGSLAEDEEVAGLRDELPEAFVVDTYVSAEGAEPLLSIAGGALGPLAERVAGSGPLAASIGVGDDDELQLALRAEPLDEMPLVAFEPILPDALPAATLGYLGIGEPGEGLTAVLDRFPGLRRQVERGNPEAGEALAGALGEEAALTLQPPAGAGDVSGPIPSPAPASLPDVGLTTDADESPELDRVLRELGVRRVDLVESGERLASNELFEAVTDGFDDELSLLAYLDLDRLVTLGEGLGLAQDPVYAIFASEFRRLDAIGAAVDADSEVLAVDVRVLIGEPEKPAPDAPPVAPAD